MLGIALGVAALIIVLSVMNGFQKEVRDRMLSVIAHVELFDTTGNGLDRWQTLAEAASKNPQVAAAAPFVSAQALLARGEDMHGVMVRGISPDEESNVTPLAAQLKDTVLTKLQPGAWALCWGRNWPAQWASSKVIRSRSSRRAARRHPLASCRGSSR